jgi:hypothetical protein
MLLTRIALGLAAAAPLAQSAFGQHAEPFHIRNLNPLVAIFGLPAWDTVAPGTQFGASLELANHYRLSLRGTDLLILDGETLRTNLSYSHGFANGWSLGAEAPYYRISGGVLDDLIDGWHSAFGMPDGGRNNRPEGQLLFRMADSDGPFFAMSSPQSGLGDTQLKVARTFGPDREFVVQASVKLPTGDADVLMGSGSTDWGITLLRSRPLLGRQRPAGYYWGLGVIRVGEPEQIDFDAGDWVYTAIVGGSWQPWPKFGLKAQLDLHGAFYDSPLEEIGEDAIQATFGAWRPVGPRGTIEFALVEDVEVSTAPDVVLQVAAKWQW